MPIKITLKDGEQFWDVGKLFFGSVAASCLEVTKTDGNEEALGENKDWGLGFPFLGPSGSPHPKFLAFWQDPSLATIDLMQLFPSPKYRPIA